MNIYRASNIYMNMYGASVHICTDVCRGEHGLRACRCWAATPQNPFFPSIRNGFPSSYPSHRTGPAGCSFPGKYRPLGNVERH